MDHNTGETAPHNKLSPHILRPEPTSRFEPKCLTLSHFEKKGNAGGISTLVGVQIQPGSILDREVI